MMMVMATKMIMVVMMIIIIMITVVITMIMMIVRKRILIRNTNAMIVIINSFCYACYCSNECYLRLINVILFKKNCTSIITMSILTVYREWVGMG